MGSNMLTAGKLTQDTAPDVKSAASGSGASFVPPASTAAGQPARVVRADDGRPPGRPLSRLDRDFAWLFRAPTPR